MMRGLLTVFAALLSPVACAQTFPERLAHYIVPGSPGSGADILGRIIVGGLTQLSGQQVVVENQIGRAHV